MIGSIVVLEPAAFQAWLAGGASGGSLASAGEKLFQDLACVTCHKADSGARGPNLTGLYGRPVALFDGSTVTADETYLRESIVAPSAKIVAGYQPIMPTFQGLVTEEQLLQLVAYVRSLEGTVVPPVPAAAAPAAPPAPGSR
jgi:cytochrome c oxidase subunit 2